MNPEGTDFYFLFNEFAFGKDELSIHKGSIEGISKFYKIQSFISVLRLSVVDLALLRDKIFENKNEAKLVFFTIQSMDISIDALNFYSSAAPKITGQVLVLSIGNFDSIQVAGVNHYIPSLLLPNYIEWYLRISLNFQELIFNGIRATCIAKLKQDDTTQQSSLFKQSLDRLVSERTIYLESQLLASNFTPTDTCKIKQIYLLNVKICPDARCYYSAKLCTGSAKEPTITGYFRELPNGTELILESDLVTKKDSTTLGTVDSTDEESVTFDSTIKVHSVLFDPKNPICYQLGSFMKEFVVTKKIQKQFKKMILEFFKGIVRLSKENSINLFPSVNDAKERDSCYKKLFQEIDAFVSKHLEDANLSRNHIQVLENLKDQLVKLKGRTSKRHYESSNHLNFLTKYTRPEQRPYEQAENLNVENSSHKIVSMPLLKPYLTLKLPGKSTAEIGEGRGDLITDPTIMAYNDMMQERREIMMRAKRIGE